MLNFPAEGLFASTALRTYAPAVSICFSKLHPSTGRSWLTLMPSATT